MSFRIAISGKGGVGKTSLAGLIVLRLIARGCRPVLAVDADPNTCLDAALGVKAHTTVGSVREQAREIVTQGEMKNLSKHELLELKISESLVEADDFDLIAMGRPEGPGCYCYANNVLKSTISAISSHYPYMVLDNEAGLENLSRRIVQTIDLLIMVSDPSQRGLETVRRLYHLAKEMGISYQRLAVVVNRLRQPELPASMEELKRDISADFVIGLPEDSLLAQSAEYGWGLSTLPPDNAVVRSIDAFLNNVFESWLK